MEQNKRWTSEELDFLEQYRTLLTISQIAQRLGKSYSSVGSQMFRKFPNPAKSVTDGKYTQITKWLELSELSNIINDMERCGADYSIRQNGALSAVFRRL